MERRVAHLLCVSDHANLCVTVRAAKPPLYDDRGNLTRERIRGLAAQFERGGCPDWAKEVVFKRFSFRGIPDGIAREHRIGTFDSLQAQQDLRWSDEEREIVERFLEQHASRTANFIVVQKPRVEAPWASYDELTVVGRRTAGMVAEKIVQVIRDTGVNPDAVIQYELENANRPEVVEAVRAFKLEGRTAEPEETVIAA